MIVLRTSISNSRLSNREFVWVKNRSKITFFQSGLELNLDTKARLSCRPKGAPLSINWIAVQDNAMEKFLDKFHADVLDAALIAYRQMNGTVIKVEETGNNGGMYSE